MEFSFEVNISQGYRRFPQDLSPPTFMAGGLITIDVLDGLREFCLYFKMVVLSLKQ